MPELLCFAHRGASGHEPENTLRALRKALDLGAPWIEVDVHTVGGEILVIHDDHLERTTNGTGVLADHDLAYLRSLDAGKGEKIPLLDEVLDLIAGRAGLNIELKGRGTAEPVAALLSRRLGEPAWGSERLLISSFDLRELVRFQKLLPDARIDLLVARTIQPYHRIAAKMGAYSLHVGSAGVDDRFVAEAHARGLMVFVFTVNDSADLARMRDLGVDGVFTDYPELVLDPT